MHPANPKGCLPFTKLSTAGTENNFKTSWHTIASLTTPRPLPLLKLRELTPLATIYNRRTANPARTRTPKTETVKESRARSKIPLEAPKQKRRDARPVHPTNLSPVGILEETAGMSRLINDGISQRGMGKTVPVTGSKLLRRLFTPAFCV